MMRKMTLGSISSLSFEEEENPMEFNEFLWRGEDSSASRMSPTRKSSTISMHSEASSAHTNNDINRKTSSSSLVSLGRSISGIFNRRNSSAVSLNNNNNVNEKNKHQQQQRRPDSNSNGSQSQPQEHRYGELHEFLADRLGEQVSHLIKASIYRDFEASQKAKQIQQDKENIRPAYANQAPVNMDDSSLFEEISLTGLKAVLTESVHDILKESEEEPYGVRGATIFLRFKEASDPNANGKFLGTIAVDHETVSTFNLILTIQEEGCNFNTALKNWINRLGGSMKQERTMSPEFKLAKEKLYRTNNW